MVKPAERLVNLALYLADARDVVTWIQIQENVDGYPSDQEEATFRRMLERDKEDLRSAGLVIESNEEGEYRLDRSATYVAPFELSGEEAATLRVIGHALLGDPSFPFADDLRLALAKLSAEVDLPSSGSSSAVLADENPDVQGSLVSELASAATMRKTVRFQYRNAAGQQRDHLVEPYGLFLHDGRWYFVGRDTRLDETRTYAVARVSALEVNAVRPKSPDFETPEGFDIRRFVLLPFQFGDPANEFEVTLRFAASIAQRAAALSRGSGRMEADGDGFVWQTRARSPRHLLRFVIENGPGIEILTPPELRRELATALSKVVDAHA